MDRNPTSCESNIRGSSKFMEDIYLGTAFTGSSFWDFCQDNTIDVYYSSVAHPRCNGQDERVNGMVLQAIKDRIFDDASNYATR
jgi:hypothetical protein